MRKSEDKRLRKTGRHQKKIHLESAARCYASGNFEMFLEMTASAMTWAMIAEKGNERIRDYFYPYGY